MYFYDEYGNRFTQDRVTDFLNASTHYLETATSSSLGYPKDGNRLVQQWNWYSINARSLFVGIVSNLVSDNDQLTQPGQAFQDAVDGLAPVVNLFPDQAGHLPAWVSNPSGTTDVTLSVRLRNGGNKAIIAPFTVTFYRDANLTQPIGSAVVDGIGGCSVPVELAFARWRGLGVGEHRFWAKVDSANVIGENNEGDNVMSGVVRIHPHAALLPIISH